jgi:hypothetical protein
MSARAHAPATRRGARHLPHASTRHLPRFRARARLPRATERITCHVHGTRAPAAPRRGARHLLRPRMRVTCSVWARIPCRVRARASPAASKRASRAALRSASPASLDAAQRRALCGHPAVVGRACVRGPRVGPCVGAARLRAPAGARVTHRGALRIAARRPRVVHRVCCCAPRTLHARARIHCRAHMCRGAAGVTATRTQRTSACLSGRNRAAHLAGSL